MKLALRSVDGARRVLALSGVQRFSMDDFWEGNIVLTMGLAPLGRDGWVTAEVARAALEKWGLAISKLPSDLSGFVLSSSYGAQLVAICENVSISEPGVGLAVTSLE